MFETEVAARIKNLVLNFRNTLYAELSKVLEFSKNCDTEPIDLILTGFAANAILSLCMKHKSYHFSYEEVLRLSHQSFAYCNGDFILKSPNQNEVEQVEMDKEDYSSPLYSYNYTAKSHFRPDPFEIIAEIMVEKLQVSPRQGFTVNSVSLILEKEYLRIENQVQQEAFGNLEILGRKIFKRIWRGY